MVSVAQLVEHQVVVLRVVGSIPTAHPKIKNGMLIMISRLLHIYYDQAFLGFVLVLFGVTLILKAIFKFNLPLLPLFGGIMLIYAGLSILMQIQY
jgi:hypothetical protein